MEKAEVVFVLVVFEVIVANHTFWLDNPAIYYAMEAIDETRIMYFSGRGRHANQRVRWMNVESSTV